MRKRTIKSHNPFPIRETTNVGNNDLTSKTLRTGTFGQSIDPSKKTLILISAGQSNRCSIGPSSFSPVNAASLDNFNFYDSCIYAAADPLLGSQWSVLGTGSVAIQVADKFITAGTFNRVIIVPCGVGSSSVDTWDLGILGTRLPYVFNRLKEKGITPSTTGTTWALEWGQGEADTSLATTRTAYAASLTNIVNRLTTLGYTGDFFLSKSTWVAGVTSTNVRNAIDDVVAGVAKCYQGADGDSLTAGSRQVDNTHYSDAGLNSLATLIYNAMVAKGAPYV